MTRGSRRGLLAACVLALLGPATARAQDAFIVVVHESNPVSALTLVELSYLFLKRMPTWGHGGDVDPVDLPDVDPTRAEFSRVVHGRSVAALAAYWRQQAFAGKAVAPPVRPTPDDVIRFVAADPLAIGYVPRGTPLPDRVKPVAIQDLVQDAVYDETAVEPPVRLSSPPLRYPALLRRDGIEGEVLLEFVVLPDGRVARGTIAVVTTTDDRFNDAAISVAQASRFRPGRLDGAAVPVRVRQRMEFTIAR